MVRLFSVFLILFILSEAVVEAKIVHVNRPYSYELLELDLKNLQARYAAQVEVKSIGITHFGRTIWGVKLGKGEKNIILIGSHHGREWMTSSLLMTMLESYSEAYQQNKQFGPVSTNILDEVSIWFVPMLNPDGVAIQQHNIKGFPTKHQKQLLLMNEGEGNFKRWKANGMGIDLNRQYPAGWDQLETKPNSPHFKAYKGKKPLESVEVKALSNFINEIDPMIAVSYHTAGREIFWHYKNGKELKRDKRIAKRIAKLTGYKLSKPETDAVGGGFTDWFITAFHRPALTIEISYLVGETNPPLAVFKEEWKRNRYVGLKLAEEARNISH